MYKMGTDDGSTGLPETNKIRDHSDAVGVDNKIDNHKSSPGSSSINVDSNIDDYIESLCMLVMTRRQDTNALFSKPEISQPVRRLSDKTKPSGIIFISKKEDMTWFASAKRFDDLTKYTGGLLQRSRFSECIAMNKISQDFAAELFDALCLRNNIKGDSINKGELHEFWYQIIDKSFDSRLQPFIYMMDKDQDGRITQDDVRKIISLSASTNNLSNIKNQAEEYAAFIIEELDLDELGYITINNLEMLLLHAPQNNKRVESQKLTTRQSGNTIRRWYEDFSLPKVLINSTYGAPAQDYKKYEVVLLVGSGTPIINIVKDMLNNIKAKEDEDNTGKLQKNKSGPTNFNTTRAYLYWVTSEQGSFDRFKDIINEAAEMDKYGVIELHAYCTSVFEEDDIRSAFITILQSLYYARNGIDVVSGTRVKSRFAEPNWRYLYKQIALSHTGSRIGVFYCGEPAPAKELKQLAHDFSYSKTTKFDFHKQI